MISDTTHDTGSNDTGSNDTAELLAPLRPADQNHPAVQDMLDELRTHLKLSLGLIGFSGLCLQSAELPTPYLILLCGGLTVLALIVSVLGSWRELRPLPQHLRRTLPLWAHLSGPATLLLSSVIFGGALMVTVNLLRGGQF